LAGKFLGGVSQHGGHAGAHVDKATFSIQFVDQVAQRLDHSLVALEGVVEFHLEVALFNRFLHRKQQLAHEAG
jgi:hypothetical protein